MTWIVGAILASVIALALVPRDVFRVDSRRERQFLRTYFVFRLFSPLIFEYLGKNSDRYFTSGGWDSQRYHSVGVAAFGQLSAGLPVTVHAEVPGTGAVELMAGYFYLIIGGPDRMVAVYMWATLATIGGLLFWWATRDLIAQRRNLYTGVVLLAPTLLFWNSTLGKEAFISLGLGCLTAAFRFILMRRVGVRTALYGVTGLLAIGFVRPHVMLALFGGCTLAIVLSRSSRRVGQRPGGRFLLAAVIVGGLALSISLSSDLLRVQSGENLIDAAYDRAESTAGGQGGSAFASEPVRSPLQIPGALAIVLLRPYPWEIRTFFQALATLESMVILVLALRHFGGVAQGRLRIDLSVLTLTAAFYTIIFASAISSYGNFGLVVRQRMQVWPFVIFLVFSAVPVVRRARSSRVASTAVRR